MTHKTCFTPSSAWARMHFLVLLFFLGFFLSVVFTAMNTSLSHFKLASSLFQDDVVCKVLSASKILHLLPSDFIAAYFPSCCFILVGKVGSKFWCALYAGQNHFLVGSSTVSGAISESDCQLSPSTAILISCPLENISVNVWWFSAVWEHLGVSSFTTARLFTRTFWMIL